MKLTEIKVEELNPKKFIEEKIREIRKIVADETAINALSGGVDSSVVTLLGHQALQDKLKTYFIDHGMMREGEPDYIVSLFKNLGIKVKIIKASKEFFLKLKGKTDPEEKREAITAAFYQNIFSKLVKKSGAKFLLHGTNYTDVEETVAKVKRQHNILNQLGIDTWKKYGYRVIEPIVQLRKPAVRIIAKALGLPAEICQRPPFPGPALSARIIGEVTPKKVYLIKKATEIVEEELKNIKAFQYFAILHQDKVTGVRKGKREFGYQIEIRSFDSKDAVTATPSQIPYRILTQLAKKITDTLPQIVSVTYNISSKPPSTIEAV